MRKHILVLACLSIAALIAGCASPDESVDDDRAGSATSSTPEFIVVDGATYECDDTLDGDGVCDGYELNEGNAGDGTAQTVTTNADGTLTVGGATYVCDNTDMVDADVVDTTDTSGECERYDRDE